MKARLFGTAFTDCVLAKTSDQSSPGFAGSLATFASPHGGTTGVQMGVVFEVSSSNRLASWTASAVPVTPRMPLTRSDAAKSVNSRLPARPEAKRVRFMSTDTPLQSMSCAEVDGQEHRCPWAPTSTLRARLAAAHAATAILFVPPPLVATRGRGATGGRNTKKGRRAPSDASCGVLHCGSARCRANCVHRGRTQGERRLVGWAR